jgi:hydroxylaminobenzene mutase
MNRLQVQLGFVLILLALLSGFGMPLFVNPRLGLAAHVVGITGGLVLIALGALASSFVLGRRAAAVMMWTWVYAAYANWFGSLIGALTGASRLTPIAGAGTSGDALAESVVSFLLESLAIAAIVGTALAVWGLRKGATVRAAQPIAPELAAPPA